MLLMSVITVFSVSQVVGQLSLAHVGLDIQSNSTLEQRVHVTLWISCCPGNTFPMCQCTIMPEGWHYMPTAASQSCSL